MRSLIAATIFSFLFSIQSFAGDNTFVPSTPNLTITSGDEEGLVSITPTFSGSEVSGIDISAPNASYTLQASEWLVYESIDPAVKLLGGFEAHTNNLVYSTTTFEELVFPYSVNIDGIAVDRIRIYGAPKIELLSSMGEILAQVSMIPDFTDNVTHQPNRQALVLSKEFNDAVVYNWYMKNSSTSQNSWMSTFQIVVRFDGQVGARSSTNDLDDAFFSIQSSFEAVGCKLRNNGNLRSLNGNLAGWKATLTNQMVNQFSFVCSQGVDEILLSTFTDADPSGITMPDFVIHSTSASIDYAVSEAEALNLNTTYTAQLRYSVSSDSKAGTNYSFWSQPYSFTTESNSSENNKGGVYELLMLDSSVQLEANKPVDLTFELKNTGDYTGSPSAYIRLPFNIFEQTEDLINAKYKIVLVDVEGECQISIDGIYSVFSCKVNNLEARDTVRIKLTATFKGNGISDRISWAVCESGNCNLNYIDTGLAVNQSPNSEVPSSDESSNNESSGSSGGAILILLLAVPFLRRRKLD